MSDPLKKYMQCNVPRYTSYPTAPHFTPTITSADYVKELSALDPDEPISLYLHVPFCRQLCWYCGCNMKLASREAPIAQYAATLKQEISLLADHLPARMKISHLHWGGGTPTALLPDDLEAVMQHVRRHFTVLPDAELAIESDPRTLTPEMVTRIGQLAFTRASFGVQEFDEDVQAAINRVQPPGLVRASVDGLRNAGVSDINFDLIYGLPLQTEESLRETIRLCVEMAPSRIALFGYAHVPWIAKKQRLIDETTLPSGEERLLQARMAAEALTDAGYIAVGIDHFARSNDPLAKAACDGGLRRNFQGYTTDQAQTMLGVGSTSIGRTPSSYFQNTSETGAWARAIEAGVLPINKGCPVSHEDKLRAHVIESLMCYGEADLGQAAVKFGYPLDWYADAMLPLAELERDGMIEMSHRCIRVTDQGSPILRVIASVFDTYLEASPTRHAVAV